MFNIDLNIKQMNTEQLNSLAADIRQFLIESVSKTGGHLASNLGVVEITLALHRVFNIDKDDHIVWDVGHQSYTHKILTGRADRFETLRKFGGLSGFPKYEEDPRDVFNTGHSSTSISAAAGIAKAKELNHNNGITIAVIGDGSMTGGMAYEALNYAGHTTKNLIIVFNDNGMSISKNIGGFSNAMRKLRNANKYLQFKDDFKSVLDSIPVFGSRAKKKLRRLKNEIKQIVLKGNVMFEGLGYAYMGPVDGHNIDELIRIFEHAKYKDQPVFIHVKTKKGKGYRQAEVNPGLFHGVGEFEPISGRFINNTGAVGWSNCFGTELCRLAAEDESVVAVTAAMPGGTGLSEFSKKFPSRFFDVGIAEQHAVTFSGGLCRIGLTPVFAVYSSFLQRAYDQILHDICLQNLHVIFGVDRSGPVGADGETHQGIYDISFLSHMPNITILSPAVEDDMKAMLEFAVKHLNSPVAIRYPRGSVLKASDLTGLDIPKLTAENCTKARLIKFAEAADVLLISVGVMLKNAFETERILNSKGVNVIMIDLVCVKPIDIDTVKNAAEKAALTVTIENNVEIGGIGQMLEAELDIPIMKFAYPDEPVCQGSIAQIEDKYGLSGEKIAQKILSNLNQGAI